MLDIMDMDSKKGFMPYLEILNFLKREMRGVTVVHKIGLEFALGHLLKGVYAIESTSTTSI